MKRLVFAVAVLYSSLGYTTESYQPGQMGSYIALCGEGKTEGMCQMYLAGYRAGMHDYETSIRTIERMQNKDCSGVDGNSKPASCRVDPRTITMSLYDGCSNQAGRLGANVMHEIILNYVKKHKESLKDPFPVVFQRAVQEAFPCKE